MPTLWSEYVTWLDAAWLATLDGATDERQVHRFLEQNPVLLPRPLDVGAGHQGPAGGILFTEIALQGIGKNRRPDFMWISTTSTTVTPVFIEIEMPNRPYFNAKQDFTQPFLHACDQLDQWRDWWNKGENQLWFKQEVLTPVIDPRGRAIRPKYALIYGRSAEFDNDPTNQLRARVGNKAAPGDAIMSFDRLRPHPDLTDVSTVRQQQHGGWELRGVPASFTTGTMTMDVARLTGTPKRSVFDEVPLWSGKRSRYVYDRWLFWRDVSRQHGKNSFRRPQNGE